MKLDKILFEFEFIPVLFSCVDKYNNFYLCLCSEIRKYQEWIVTAIEPKMMIDLLKDRITIYDAFKNLNSKKTIITYKEKKIASEEKDFDEINERLLPDRNEYLEDEGMLTDYINKLSYML